MTVTVHYEEGGPSLTAELIRAWNRGDIDHAISGGSGPKDYVKNDIFAAFEARPEVDRILMLRAAGPPFLLLREDGKYWFDVTGKQVLMSPANRTAAAHG